MTDKLMTAGAGGAPFTIGTGLAVSGGTGSKVLGVTAVAGDYVGVSLTTVAGESIAAGDVVSMCKYGIRKGFGLLTGSSEITTVNVALSSMDICALTSTLFVKVYQKSADSKLYAQAFKVDANAWTITEGAEVTVANYAIGVYSCRVRRINDTTFVAGWMKGADVHGYCIGGSVDATPTITLDAGGEVEFHNNQTAGTTSSFVGSTGWDFQLLTTNTIIIAYRDGDDSNYGRVVLATLVGTAVTVDTAHETRFSGALATDNIAISIHSATRAEIHYEIGGTTGGYNILIKVSGTTPSLGTAFGAWITGAIAGMSADAMTPWRAGVVACNTTGVNFGINMPYANELSYDQMFGTGVLTNAGKCFLTMLSPWLGIITYLDGTNVYIKSLLVKVGTCCTGHFFIGPTNIHASDNDYAVAISTDKKVLAVFFTDSGDAHKGHLLLYDIGIPIGLAQAANSGGSALDICVWGMSDVQSGLASGRMHFMSTDGTLPTTCNGIPAGHAYSATQLILEGFPQESI